MVGGWLHQKHPALDWLAQRQASARATDRVGEPNEDVADRDPAMGAAPQVADADAASSALQRDDSAGPVR